MLCGWHHSGAGPPALLFEAGGESGAREQERSTEPEDNSRASGSFSLSWLWQRATVARGSLNKVIAEWSKHLIVHTSACASCCSENDLSKRFKNQFQNRKKMEWPTSGLSN